MMVVSLKLRLQRSEPEDFTTRIFSCAEFYFALEHWILNESYLEPSHPYRCLTISNVGDPVQLEFGRC